MRCMCLTGTEVGIVVHGELPSGPFIGVHILMSQTQKERQEARSALNTVISSSKRTTRVSSTSPPLGLPPPPPPHIQLFSSSNDPGGGWRVRDGLSWVKLQGALMAGRWKAGGQLCCLLGLSPRWAVIKSRPWCEAFCWGSSGLLSPVSLDVSLGRDVTKCLLFVFWINHSS